MLRCENTGRRDSVGYNGPYCKKGGEGGNESEERMAGKERIGRKGRIPL